jgi:hypothetical protein
MVRAVYRRRKLWTVAVFAIDGAGESGVVRPRLGPTRMLLDIETGFQSFKPGPLADMKIKTVMQKIMQFGPWRRWRRNECPPDPGAGKACTKNNQRYQHGLAQTQSSQSVIETFCRRPLRRRSADRILTRP